MGVLLCRRCRIKLVQCRGGVGGRRSRFGGTCASGKGELRSSGDSVPHGLSVVEEVGVEGVEG